MTNHLYSLEFLNSDWDGAGYDFCFTALFDANKLNTQLIRQFVDQISNDCKSSLKFIQKSAPDKWQLVSENEFRDFLNNRFNWNENESLIVEIATQHGFLGYIEFNHPDQVVIGGPSESYYKGDTRIDKLVAEDLAELIVTAVTVFGEGYGCFGAGCNATSDTENLRRLNSGPNLSRTIASKLTAEIYFKCEEIRVLYNE